MKTNFIKTATEEKKFTFVKGWIDDFSNIAIIIDVSGKKFSVFKGSNSQDWLYFFGTGSNKITVDMPVGRGDFFIGSKVELEYQDDINLLMNSISESSLEKIKNKFGISWSPKTGEEKSSLANLVDQCGRLNSYLSSLGLLYTGSDKIIYGEDVKGSDVLNYRIKSGGQPSAGTVPTRSPEVSRTESPSSETRAGVQVVSSPGLPPGVSAASDVKWSPGALIFIKKLRDTVDQSIPINVRSVIRDYKTQAGAMLNKWKLGGDQEIKDIYGDKAAYFLAAPKNVESWARVVEEVQKKGLGFTGGHLMGSGIDIRTKNLTRSQVNQLVEAVKRLGARPKVENNPYHLHVDKFSPTSG